MYKYFIFSSLNQKENDVNWGNIHLTNFSQNFILQIPTEPWENPSWMTMWDEEISTEAVGVYILVVDNAFKVLDPKSEKPLPHMINI